jgi:hypothetical protein
MAAMLPEIKVLPAALTPPLLLMDKQRFAGQLTVHFVFHCMAFCGQAYNGCCHCKPCIAMAACR